MMFTTSAVAIHSVAPSAAIPHTNATCGNLLIGDSILTDVESAQSAKLKVHSVGGAHIGNIRHYMRKVKDNYSEVVFVIGTNDCSTQSDS